MKNLVSINCIKNLITYLKEILQNTKFTTDRLNDLKKLDCFNAFFLTKFSYAERWIVRTFSFFRRQEHTVLGRDRTKTMRVQRHPTWPAEKKPAFSPIWGLADGTVIALTIRYL